MNDINQTDQPIQRKSRKLSKTTLWIVSVFTIAVSGILLQNSGFLRVAPRIQPSEAQAKLEADNALKLQNRKDKLTEQELLTAQWKSYLLQERFRQKAKDVPRNARLWGAFLFSLIASFVAAIVIISSGFAFGIAKVCMINADTLAIVFASMRKIPPEEYKARIEGLRFQREQLKMHGETKKLQPIIDIGNGDLNVPTLRQCIDDGLINTNTDDFLTGFDSGEPVYENFKRACSGMAIAGKQEQGKTTTACLIASQLAPKGYQGITIDLHAGHRRSFSARMAAFKASKNFKCLPQLNTSRSFWIIALKMMYLSRLL